MDEENFWADVQAEEIGPCIFVPVLVMGIGDEPDQVSRVPLGGQFASAEAALCSARDSIDAMTLGDASGVTDTARSPTGE